MKGTPKKLVFPETKHYQSSAVEIAYIKSRDVLWISAFYDSGFCGIEGTEISIKDFCERLGINLNKKR